MPAIGEDKDAEDEPEAAYVPLGYVSASAGTVVYAEESLETRLGMITDDGVVYAYSAMEAKVTRSNVTAVAFAVDGVAVYGYVRTVRLSALEEVYDPYGDSALDGVAVDNVEFDAEEPDETEAQPGLTV